jgi:hypothetical protein
VECSHDVRAWAGGQRYGLCALGTMQSVIDKNGRKRLNRFRALAMEMRTSLPGPARQLLALCRDSTAGSAVKERFDPNRSFLQTGSTRG